MVSQVVIDARVSGLIGRFYEAAADDTLWTGIAAEISDTLESTSAVLKLHGADDDIRVLEHTDNLRVADREQSWAENWHRQDLWVERSARFGVGRIVTDHDLVSPSEQRGSGFYQEWLRALDIFHMVGAVFPGSDGALGVLGIHRPERAGAYADADRHKVSILLPHLQRAFWLGGQFAKAAAHRALAAETLSRIDAAVFAVDARCRIVSANARAEALLRAGIPLFSERGRLRLADGALDQCMTRQVRACVQTAQGHAAAIGAALTISRAERLPLTMIVAPLPPSGLSGPAATARPLALVMVRDPEASTLATDCLRDLFGFTRMEAIIAADLAGGLSLDAVAKRRGIGGATVRSHLKRILTKTGTHRQAQAVALIARSVAGLDKNCAFLP
ncbi:MAG: helix-turn-helix transcriptional regulator [Altererythrobacter sp.]|nr:helix-turn-helix transcriptional regulator [Altererythrobacter sp.]OJU59369.1 MAG: helix-turn-helix transcriptional regulator [Altererythrobacter sp. 66-12]